MGQSRFLKATAAGVLAVAASLTALTGNAAAHVSASGEIAPGANGTVTFTVPNERDDANTVRLEVKIPDEAPLGSLRVKPKPGWTITTTTRTLAEPVEVFGNPVTEVIDTIVWQADGPGIAPDQYDTFEVRGGPFPDDAERVAFPAVQTYSSGEEVAWIELAAEGAEEPEHPAPVLTLTEADGAAGGGDHGGPADDEADSDDDEAAPAAGDTSDDDSDSSTGIAIAALVAGILGIAVGGVALAKSRPAP
ncbi:MAG: YcnI family protein [Actinomycetota bacterium]|nr:YcnI family protein [Actinomycetota bacterium]